MKRSRMPIAAVCSVLIGSLAVYAAGGRTTESATSDPPPSDPPAWRALSEPPSRFWAATTFLPSPYCQLLAFGGLRRTADGRVEMQKDTIIYSFGSDQWVTIPPPARGSSAPPAQSGGALSWDPAAKVAILFGGGSGVFSDATYTFNPDTKKWTSLFKTCQDCPAGRRYHAQVWSTALNATIVFGGRVSAAGLADWWTLSSAKDKRGNLTWRWTRLNPAPDPTYGLPAGRSGHGMAELPDGSGSILLYGGDTGSTLPVDTWLYHPRDNRFERLPDAGTPGPKHAFAIGYSWALNRIIIQGGYSAMYNGTTENTDQTWMFDSASRTWSLVATNPPDGRLRAFHHIAAPDFAFGNCGAPAIIWEQEADSLTVLPAWGFGG